MIQKKATLSLAFGGKFKIWTFYMEQQILPEVPN